MWAYSFMCLIYGTTFLAIRAGDLSGMPPFASAGVRFLAAGVVTLSFVQLRHRGAMPKGAKAYADLAKIGFFNTTVVFAVVYFVEQYVPSGYAALMGATRPFMVMLLGRFMNKHTITLPQSIGLGVGFIGVLAVAWPGVRAGVPHWVCSTMALVAAQAAAAFGTLQSRKILAQGMSSFVVNGFQGLFGGVGLFLIAGLTGGLSFRHVHEWGMGLWALTYLTVFGTIVASTIYFWLVQRSSAFLASTWTYVSPIIAVAVGYFWFHEPVYGLTIVGTVAILGGVLLLNLGSFLSLSRARGSTQSRIPCPDSTTLFQPEVATRTSDSV